MQYRIEPNLRNHTGTFNRDLVNQVVGEVVRDLTNPRFQYPVHQKPAEATKAEEPGQEVESEGTSKGDSAVAVEPADGSASAANGEHLDSVQREPASAANAEPLDSMQGELEAKVESSAQPEATSIREPATSVEQLDKVEEGKDSEVQTKVAEVSTAPEAPQSKRPTLPPHRRRTYVDLKKPTHTILVSVLKGVCGISIVTGYDEGRKFNIQMLGERQVADKFQQKKEADEAAAAASEPAAAAIEAPAVKDEAAAPAPEVAPAAVPLEGAQAPNGTGEADEGEKEGA